MSQTTNRFEYKVAFVDFRGRVSIEGEEVLIQDGERMTAFGRRYLNSLGVQGWELVDIQPQPMGAAFHVFKRALAEGQDPEPAKPIEKEEKEPASEGKKRQDIKIKIVRKGADGNDPKEFVVELPE